MKRIFPVCAAGFLAVSAMLPSCKKNTAQTHPTPNNVRISAFSIIDSAYLPTINDTVTYNHNYRLFYDESKRVSKILYTTTVPLAPNVQIMFTYNSDSIFKTIYSIGTQNVLERDTFILNSQGEIKTAFTPGTYGTTTNLEYFNGLLSREELVARDTFGSVSAQTTYTAVDADLLRHNADGSLIAKFDRLVENTANSYKLDTVLWYDGNFSLVAVHAQVGSFTDILPNYQGQPMIIVGKDGWGNIDTMRYPGIWINQQYKFYTEEGKENRPGDYMYLQSLVYYGMNIYKNKHIVREISTPGRVSKITYNIDADSKIKQTFVNIKDSALNIHNVKYDIQYELF